MSSEMDPPHLADLLELEMEARGWGMDDVAIRMSGDFGINRLALEMFLSVRDKCVVLGEQAQSFAQAFGVQAEFFEAVHERWRKAQP